MWSVCVAKGQFPSRIAYRSAFRDGYRSRSGLNPPILGVFRSEKWTIFSSGVEFFFYTEARPKKTFKVITSAIALQQLCTTEETGYKLAFSFYLLCVVCIEAGVRGVVFQFSFGEE